MREKIERCTQTYKYLDWAVLYMRFFAGAMMILHNIGKVQNYNEIIESYPALLYIDNAATFMLVTVVEVMLALMLMIGIWVRISALLLTLGVVVAYIWGGFRMGEIHLLWAGIYMFLVISGGGIYGFDKLASATKKLEN